MNENKKQFTGDQELRKKIRKMIMETLQENDLGSMEKEITGDLARQRAGTLRGARGQEPGRSVQPASRRERERQEAGVDPINPVRSTTPPVTEEDSIEEEAKPDFLDLDGDKDKDEPMEKAAKEVEEGKGHGCASHVKENLSGREGRCINHTLLEDGSVTHYTVEFQNEIVENIPVDRLTVLAEGHHSHSAKRDDYAHDKSKPRMPFEEGEEVEEVSKPVKQSPESPPGYIVGGSTEHRRFDKEMAQRRAALEEEQPLKEWYNNTLHEALLKKFKIKK